MTIASNAADDATNRRLKSLVGLVVVLGVACIAAALVAVARGHEPIGPATLLLCCLIAVANRSSAEGARQRSLEVERFLAGLFKLPAPDHAAPSMIPPPTTKAPFLPWTAKRAPP